MKQAWLANEEFLKDVKNASVEDRTAHMWWLGQSGFLLQWNGTHVLLDPYLSDSLTRKYANTDKPHVRVTERVIDPSLLDFINVVTSSHNHTDHLDAETLNPLRAANPDLTVMVPKANLAFAAERLGCRVDELTGLESGEHLTVSGIEITAAPAAHESVDRDEHGLHRYVGYVIQCGSIRVYHSGDTVWYDGMVEYLKPFAIDIALLPINGRNPERRVPGNLTGPEAARLAYSIGAGVVIPCHYDMFEFNTVTPDAFIDEARRIGQRYAVVRNGERFTFSKPEKSGE